MKLGHEVEIIIVGWKLENRTKFLDSFLSYATVPSIGMCMKVYDRLLIMTDNNYLLSGAGYNVEHAEK